ncbi:hypothetical protein [Citrobacter koseri]|nr:hypothetical protein [Citrobacter koseri]
MDMNEYQKKIKKAEYAQFIHEARWLSIAIMTSAFFCILFFLLI